jgi:DNA-binding transcriptional ArsR family regulator
MDTDAAADILAQLGHRARLEIMRLLIQVGRDGLTVGEIQAQLDMPASTLAFHLRGLVSTGLVEQSREGRAVLCRPRFDALNGAIAFLKAGCCSGFAAPTELGGKPGDKQADGRAA